MIPVVEFFIRSPPDPGPSPTATPANPGPRKAVSTNYSRWVKP